MLENLDILLDGVIELIRIREINKARERFFEAKKKCWPLTSVQGRK